MKRKITAVLAVLMCMAWSVPVMAGDICSEPVQTAEGQIKGVSASGLSACAWKGIPYAAPPVGDLRFRAPQPPEPHAGVFEALEFGPACIQNESFGAGGKSIYGLSEDCLTINIWRPQKSGAFPVMYWIHGGGLTIGASNYEMYDGARLAAERDVVVVSINYRLNLFGFFAHPDAQKEDPDGSTGNYGMQDQIRGLEWVRENIAAFGGDPGNVTIFGESAGGLSVCNLLAAPPAAGLFHKGIIESGGCDLTAPIDKGLEKGQKLAEAVGCAGKDPLECLRDMDADELFKKFGESGVRFGSHVDGYVIPDVPINLIREGKYNRMPVMVGNNRDEIEIFLAMTGASLMPGFVIKNRMKKGLGPRYEKVKEMYPRSKFGRPVNRLISLGNDGFSSRGFMAAEDISARDPVYYYMFDWDDYFPGKYLGAFHGLEIPFVFGNISLERDSLRLILGRKKATEKARPLSGQMMSYWTNFAKTGDPNGPGLPKWPAYNTETRKRMHLDTPAAARPITDDELARLQYWAAMDLSEGTSLLR